MNSQTRRYIKRKGIQATITNFEVSGTDDYKEDVYGSSTVITQVLPDFKSRDRVETSSAGAEPVNYLDFALLDTVEIYDAEDGRPSHIRYKGRNYSVQTVMDMGNGAQRATTKRMR